MTSTCSTLPLNPVEQLEDELGQAAAQNEVLRKSLEEVNINTTFGKRYSSGVVTSSKPVAGRGWRNSDKHSVQKRILEEEPR